MRQVVCNQCNEVIIGNFFSVIRDTTLSVMIEHYGFDNFENQHFCSLEHLVEFYGNNDSR